MNGEYPALRNYKVTHNELTHVPYGLGPLAFCDSELTSEIMYPFTHFGRIP